MPPKFNTKNFAYSKPDDEPAFLRRLRTQVSSSNTNGDPDRNDSQHARPTAKKARLAFDADGEDDAPVVVFDGDVGREEWEAAKLAAAGGGVREDGDGVKADAEVEGEREGGDVGRRQEKLNPNSTLNPKKRRKVGRVIGGDVPDLDDDGDGGGLEDGGVASGVRGRVDVTATTATARRGTVGVKEAVAESGATSTTATKTRPAAKDSKLKHDSKQKQKKKKVKLSFDDA